MARDYYADARDIAQTLVQEGRAVEAESLIDVIEGGATGTEILMGLRFHLHRIQQHTPGLSANVQAEIADLWSAVNSALG